MPQNYVHKHNPRESSSVSISQQPLQQPRGTETQTSQRSPHARSGQLAGIALLIRSPGPGPVATSQILPARQPLVPERNVLRDGAVEAVPVDNVEVSEIVLRCGC